MQTAVAAPHLQLDRPDEEGRRLGLGLGALNVLDLEPRGRWDSHPRALLRSPPGLLQRAVQARAVHATLVYAVRRRGQCGVHKSERSA